MITNGRPPLGEAQFDPRGLVPVNRAQPVATDGLERQRLMERRMGTMPPSSFTGAGAAFQPQIGQAPTPTHGRVGEHYADQLTDVANAEMMSDSSPAPQLSAEAMQQLANQQMYAKPQVTGPMPPDPLSRPPAINPAQAQRERLRQAMALRRQRGFLGARNV